MDIISIGSLIGVGASTVSTLISSYVAFKKSNVELYFKQLIDSQTDLSKIGSNEQLNKIVFNIIDEVSKETTERKINNWKNLTIKLATEFDEYDTSEKYSKILADLTAFDLTILFAIYSKEFQSESFLEELKIDLLSKNLSEIDIFYSTKKLAQNFLITEHASSDIVFYQHGSQNGQQFFYKKNDLGKTFLEMIS